MILLIDVVKLVVVSAKIVARVTQNVVNASQIWKRVLAVRDIIAAKRVAAGGARVVALLLMVIEVVLLIAAIGAVHNPSSIDCVNPIVELAIRCMPPSMLLLKVRRADMFTRGNVD